MSSTGGLSGSELKNTPTAAMDGWRQHAIPTIHPDAFKVIISLCTNPTSQKIIFGQLYYSAII